MLLTAAGGAQGISLIDRLGKMRAEVAARVDGVAALSLYDKDEMPRIELGTVGDGSPWLSFTDKDGKRSVLTPK